MMIKTRIITNYITNNITNYITNNIQVTNNSNLIHVLSIGKLLYSLWPKVKISNVFGFNYPIEPRPFL